MSRWNPSNISIAPNSHEASQASNITNSPNPAIIPGYSTVNLPLRRLSEPVQKLFLPAFQPSNFWLVVIFFAIPSTIFQTYSISNMSSDSVEVLLWNNISSTVINVGTLYLTITPLVRQGVNIQRGLFGYVSLLILASATIVASWILWGLKREQWLDAMLYATNLCLFLAEAQLLAGEEDPGFLRRPQTGSNVERILHA